TQVDHKVHKPSLDCVAACWPQPIGIPSTSSAMLALMNDQKQQSNAQGYSARRASMPQREPAVSTGNNSPGVVKAADRFETQYAAELAPSNKCSCSPSCNPSAPRCSSSIVAVSSSTAGLSSAEFSSNSNYSPPSPPLLPPKRPCHQRALASAGCDGSAGQQLIFRPVPLRPAALEPHQLLVPSFESLSLQQQQQQQAGSGAASRCQSQPSLHLAAKRKHCDSCPCDSASQRLGGGGGGGGHT
uniref:Uncharacterized protein n=1 Tax=Macrostomum lignano TaxID=282301 RepID=A0A1I8G2L8_9PLAT